MTPDTESRIRGCVLGAALGDALGAPFEFRSHEEVVRATGGPWIDGLYPFEGEAGPHGVWCSPAALGTGTDDTRYNWLFLELATERGRMPSAEELAQRLLDAYDQPTRFFPRHAELARQQLAAWHGVCCGRLGETSSLHPGVPPDVLRERSVGLNYPTLIGLITLTSAGLLFPGRPEEAYTAAFQADFADIGYARECVAILAAAVSLAAGGASDADEVCHEAASLDPLDLGGPFGVPLAKERLLSMMAHDDRRTTAQETADRLSRELSCFGPFDPLKALGLAFSAVRHSPQDPLTAILIAADHRGVDSSGALSDYQDTDCYACIAGALAGALAGDNAFPGDMLRQVVEGNRRLYGFDLDVAIERFIRVCC